MMKRIVLIVSLSCLAVALWAQETELAPTGDEASLSADQTTQPSAELSPEQSPEQTPEPTTEPTPEPTLEPQAIDDFSQDEEFLQHAKDSSLPEEAEGGEADDATPPAPRRSLPLSLGAIFDINMNSPSGYAFSGGVQGEYAFTGRLSAGLKAIFGHDLGTTGSVEIFPFFRYYILDLAGAPASSGLFAELDAGLSLILASFGTMPVANAGLSAGYRLLMGNWYLEPSVRFGYPYLWGAGLGAGYRF